jgi:hypothetical protein
MLAAESVWHFGCTLRYPACYADFPSHSICHSTLSPLTLLPITMLEVHAIESVCNRRGCSRDEWSRYRGRSRALPISRYAICSLSLGGVAWELILVIGVFQHGRSYEPKAIRHNVETVLKTSCIVNHIGKVSKD